MVKLKRGFKVSIHKYKNFINVLFLDIDEVLNCSNNKYTDDEHKHIYVNGKKHHDMYNPRLISHLNDLIERYNFKIVLCSTWRKLFDIYTMRELFIQIGIKGDLIDYTTKEFLDTGYKDRREWEGDTALPRDRGLQISKWLLEDKYNIANYLILDDGIDVIYGHEDNYYRPNGQYGFDYVAYLQLTEKFDNKFGVYKY